MTQRLYCARFRAECTVCFLASDKLSEAELSRAAESALAEDAADSGDPEMVCLTLTRIVRPFQIPRDWRNGIPWGEAVKGQRHLTCAEF